MTTFIMLIEIEKLIEAAIFFLLFVVLLLFPTFSCNTLLSLFLHFCTLKCNLRDKSTEYFPSLSSFALIL